MKLWRRHKGGSERGLGARLLSFARRLLLAGLLLGPLSYAAASPQFWAAGTPAGGTGAVSPAWPVHEIDDIALLFVETAGEELANLSVPAGFQEVTNSPQYTGTGTVGTRLSVFWARATSAAMTAPTISDAGDHVYAVILTFRGAIKSGVPWDVTAGGVKGTASVSLTASGATTGVDDALLVLAASNSGDTNKAVFSGWANAGLSGIAELFNQNMLSGNGGGLGVMIGTRAVAGATGDTTASLTASYTNAWLNIALKRLTPPKINDLTVGAKELTAGWPLITGATGYALTAALVPANNPALTYSSATIAAGATVNGLAPNTTYYVYSRSNGKGENSEWSLYRATATLLEFAPTAPYFTGVTTGAAQFGWTGNNPGGTEYRVYISTAPDPLAPGAAAATSLTAFTAPVSTAALAANTTYYFKVAGFNHNNVPTAYLAASTPTWANPPVFSAFSGVGASAAQFSWTDGGNPPWTKYRAQVSTTPEFNGAAYSSSDTYNASLSSAGLTANTTYYFRAAAVNLAGILSGYTGTQTTTTFANAPASPSFSSVTPGLLQLTWAPNGNPSGTLYRVLVSTVSDFTAPAAVTSADTYGQSVSSSGLTSNTTYYFRVYAVNHRGVPAGPVDASTATLANMPAYQAFSVTTSSDIAFSWTAANPDGTLYRVAVSTAVNPLVPGFAASSSSDTYSLSLSTAGLLVNTTYYFRAAAVNRNGVATDYSSAEAAATLANTPQFSGFTVGSSGDISMAWAPNSNPSGTLYRVAVSTAPDPLVPGFAPFSSSDTYNFSLSSSGLSGNTTYYFRLAGVNRSGAVSAYAAANSTSTLAAAPSGFSFSGLSQESVRLNWSASGNGPGTLYRVQVSTAPDMESPENAVVTTTETYNLYIATAGLQFSTLYYFRAAARNNNGLLINYVSAGSTTTLAPGVLSAPVAGAYAPYVSSMTANWTLVDGATGYTLAAVAGPTGDPAPSDPSSTTVSGSDLSAYVEGLAPDTVYYLHVRANGPGSSSSWAHFPAAATLLAAPPLFDAFGGVSTAAAVFSWTRNGNAAPPATQYRVLSSTAPDPLNPGAAVAASSYTYSLSLSSSGLSANTTYYFSVAGVNKDGAFTAYTAPQATGTPANMPVFSGFSEVGTGALKFSWSAPGNHAETLYRVWSSTAPDPLNPGNAAAVSSDTYNTWLSSGGLSANTTYYFRVTGISRAGIYTGYTLAAGTSTLAAAPAFSAFTEVSSAAARFAWTGTGNPPGTLYRAQTLLTEAGEPASSSDTYNSYLSSSGLAANFAYYFRAAAVNHNGVVTDYTGVQSTRTLTAPPLFTGFSGVGPDSAQFSWSANGNPAGTLYRVLASTAADPYEPLGAVVSSSDTYNTWLSSAGLSPDMVYNFRVAGVNNWNSPTAYTAAAGTRTLAYTPAFNGFTEVWKSSAQFNWTHNGNRPGTLYRVQTLLSEGGAPVTSSDTYNTWLSSVGLTYNTTYFFKVTGVNADGSVNDYTAVKGTSTLADIPAFVGFGEVTSSKILYSWITNGNPDNTVYRIIISTVPDPLNPGAGDVRVEETMGGYLYLPVPGLMSQTTYYFRAAAYNNNSILSDYNAIQSTVTHAPVASMLYFRTEASALGGTGKLLSTARGAAAVNYVKNTLAGPVTPPTAQTQFTATAGGSPVMWYSYPIDEMTIMADVDFNIWAMESHNSANATVTAALYRAAADGGILSTIASAVLARPELSTTMQVKNWLVTPTVTTLYNGERLAVGWYIDDAGTADMGTGYTVSGALDGPATGASGDSWIRIEETVMPARPVTGAITAVTETTLAANWSLVEGATGYTLAAALSSLNPPTAIAASSTTLGDASAQLQGPLSPNTTYFLFLRTNGSRSSSLWATFPGTATLANIPVFDSFSEVSGSVIRFGWTPNGNPEGTRYRVLVSTSPGQPAPGGPGVVSSDTYNNYLSSAGLAANTTYYFSAAALSHNGVITGYTGVRSTSTLAVPPLFSGFSPVEAGSVRAAWGPNGNRPGTLYRVHVATDSAFAGTALTSSDTYNLALTSSALAANTTYYFRFAALNNNGLASGYTETSSTSTLAVTPLTPSFLAVEAGYIQAAWELNGNRPGTLFRVAVATDSAFAGAALTSSDTYNNYLSSAGLAANVTYYFKVAAVNNNGIRTDYSGFASTSTLAAQPVFAGFGSVLQNSLRPAWTDALNRPGTLYRVRTLLSEGGEPVTSSDTYNNYLSSAGLSANTTYFFGVAAVNNNGVETLYTGPHSTSTLAGLPVPGAFTEVWQSSVQFNWGVNGNPPGTLYRAQALLSEGGEPVTSSDTYNNYLSSAGLNANTTYFFKVAAVNHNGAATDYAGPASTATLAAMPAFSGFGDISEGQARFSWTEGGNPPGTLYRVAVSTSPAPLAPGYAAASSSDTYNSFLSSAGLYGNTTYYFRAAAVNRNGVVTEYSGAQSTSTWAVPPSVFDFTGVSSYTVRLNWGEPGNGPATLYRVQVSTALNLDAPANAVVTTTETYHLFVTTTGLDYSTLYRFRVLAVNNNGIATDWFSAGSTTTLAPGAMSAPLAGAYDPYSSSITANWSLVSGATGYTLAASLVPGAEPASLDLSSVTHADENSAYVEGLAPDTVYYLFARANGTASSSAWATFPPLATLLAAPPQFGAFSAVGSASADFSWTANGNAPPPATRYHVVSSTAPDPLNPAGAVAVSSYTYNLSLSSAGLSANTTYYFRVAGINKDGVPTAYTAAQATATAANMPLFANFSAMANNALQFNWSPNGNPDGTLYRVLASTAPNPAAPVGAPFSSSDTYNTWLSSSGLYANTTYYFSVAAVSRAGFITGYAATRATSTLANTPAFSAFSGVGVSAAGLAWTENSNRAGTLYRVLTSTSSDIAADAPGVTSSATYSLAFSSAGLTANTTYYFRVAGVNNNGVLSSFFTYESTPTAAAQPAAPGFSAVAETAAQFSWDDNGNPAGTLYRADTLLSAGGEPVTSSYTYNTWLSSSGLSVNTTYFFRAAAVNHAGIYTAYTADYGTSTLAAAPVFSAFTGVSSFTASLSWTAPANPPGTLYRAETLLSAGGQPVSSSDTYNAYLSSSGLNADTAYYFRAAAVNHNGVATAYTETKSTHTLTAPPLFSSFSGVVSDAAQFAWSANGNPGGTLYRVLASTAADPHEPLGAALSSSDTYNTWLSSAGLSPDMIYNFRVAGVNAAGSPTAYTAVSGTRTLANTPLFSGFTGVWVSSVQFNWTHNGNRPGTLYRAQTLLSEDGEPESSSDTYNTWLSSEGLTHNTTYFFRVTGVNADGAVNAYTALQGTSTLADMPVFTNFSEVTSSKIKFNWDAAGNPAGTLYRVLVATVTDPANPGDANVRAEETSSNYVFLTGLLSQTTYYFRAAAYNNNAILSDYSAAQSTATLPSSASILYFRTAASALGGTNKLLSPSRGTAAATYVKNTFGGPVTPPTVNTQFTVTAGGSTVMWYSYPLDEITLGADVNFNIWAMENNKAGNAAVTAELYRTDGAGSVISTIASVVLSRAELGTAMTAENWLKTPVQTTLASGDRLAVAWYMDDAAAVTMAAGYTLSAALDGPSSGLSGDSWVRVDETLAPARPVPGAVTPVTETALTAAWSLVEGATGYTLAASLSGVVPPVAIAASSVTLGDAGAKVEAPLTPNTTYYLFARSNGYGASSAWVTFPATATLANIPLAGDFTEVSATSAKFNWTENSNPGGTLYRVQVSTAIDLDAPLGAAVTTHDTYDLYLASAGLDVGGFYNFRVAAVNHRGRITAYTAAKGTTTLAVYLNEVYPSGASAAADWVELYNNTDATVPLSGWKLDYVQNTIALGGTPITVWTGQAGDSVAPHSVFRASGFSIIDLNGAQPHHVKLLDSFGGLMGRVQWPALAAGQSFARVTDGNPLYFEIDPTPTPGYANAVSTDTFLINEAAYGPLAGQFIELYNASDVSTRTLTGYYLRSKASSAGGLAFRFSRKLFPRGYALLDSSSVSDDGYTFVQVFGASGLAAAGDFLALENSSGSVADAAAWQSPGNNPRYDNTGAALPLTVYAPANAAYSIERRPSEGSDTGSDFVDFGASASYATPGSRNEANNGGDGAANTLYYPQDGQVLSRRFPLRLKLGAVSLEGQADTLIFSRTGGAADARSPHTFRLAEIGFGTGDTSDQDAGQYGPSFLDQDGYPLVSSAAYKLTFNSDNASVSAPQVKLGTVTYDGSVHTVTASTAAPLWMNNAARAAMIKLQVSNNSPAGFNALQLTTAAFTLLDDSLAPQPRTQAQARTMFDAFLLAVDSGTAGLYEPGIDLSTAAYVPNGAISLDLAGLSTLTVTAQYLYETSVPAGSTRTFYLVLESTQNASPGVFRVRFSAAGAGLRDASGLLPQDFLATAELYTSSVTFITQSSAPANTAWPYVSPSSAPVNTLAGTEMTGLVTARSYVASTDGYLRAVASTGTLIWEFPTSPLSPINSNPTDSYNEGGAAYIYFANDLGDVYKLRDNGSGYTLVWKRSMGFAVRSDITVSGSSLYFGAADNAVHCIDMADPAGANCFDWTDLPVAGVISGTPMVDNRTGVNMAWIGTENGGLQQVNTGDGSPGNAMSAGAIMTSPFGDIGLSDSSNKLFITSTDGKLYVAPLDLTDIATPFPQVAPIYTSPFIWGVDGGRYVFFGDDDGYMHKVSTETWTEPAGWPFKAGGAIRSSPVVVPGAWMDLAANYVYFGSDDGYVYAVNTLTGQLRSGWPVATGGPVRADGVVDSTERTLIVGSNDGRTYVLNIGP
ncbi:MAG TPA: hypothetical protein DEQ38_10670 [Elusimicrobia bacterium]|nr:MAG: hypothetical protein A2089_14610 [Elusimicrobia bacterium GWD2_63_28]HCC48560.1 hypothetical protein [Elusimicrobiota bacterium]